VSISSAPLLSIDRLRAPAYSSRTLDGRAPGFTRNSYFSAAQQPNPVENVTRVRFSLCITTQQCANTSDNAVDSRGDSDVYSRRCMTE